jgi:serine/threonine protein kinase/Tol biopolymer transport system component
MSLVTGTRLGPYEIVSLLGEGGMGQVYRAKDTRLKRDVALKILPDAFAADPDRVARFQREAELLATLNHPNIAAIYGLEQTDGVRALVLELVEGPTLADRIAQGPIPIDEALLIAGQIADALEAAHEKGVIHRDLKPANIKLTQDDKVKVLDFGLAKMLEPASASSPALTNSPTITTPAMMTGVGTLLGTAAYMSPEQAKGRPADKRSDIWAFGCVLYEMLTGKRAFEAEDISDTLAAVLRADPEWRALPGSVSATVLTTLKGCLEKDRRTRVPDISLVRFVLEGRITAPASSSLGQSTAASRIWPMVAAMSALALVTTVVASYLRQTVAAPIGRFVIISPDNQPLMTGDRVSASVTISPDGRKLAFTTRDPTGTKVTLWIRPIDALTAQAVPGADGAQFPFWSPDSRAIAFFTKDRLLKLDIAGGPPQVVCDCSGRGGTWSRDGVIVFNNGPGPLMQVSSAGGQPTALTRLEKGDVNNDFPAFLPDGRHVLYFAVAGQRRGRVRVASLDSPDTRSLVEASTGAVYAERPGVLLFARDGTLLAQPFDPSKLTLTGEPMPVAEGVSTSVYVGVTAFSVSQSGTLAYGEGTGVSGGAQQLVWVDRQGKFIEAIGAPENYRGIDLSPDGKYVVAHHHDGAGGDLWITDLTRRTTSRFTFEPNQDNSSPVWSADGRSIVFASVRGGQWGIYRKLVDGSGPDEQLVGVHEKGQQIIPTSTAPDGRSIVYAESDGKRGDNIWLLPLAGDHKPLSLINSTFTENQAQVSPDGKWLAYYTDADGTARIYARRFPTGTGQWQISTGIGAWARWRADGEELFYLDSQSQGNLMAVPVRQNGSSLEVGTPKMLFDSGFVYFPSAHLPFNGYAVSRDGQRFLIPRLPSIAAGGRDSSSIVVVMNWADEVRQRMATK